LTSKKEADGFAILSVKKVLHSFIIIVIIAIVAAAAAVATVKHDISIINITTGQLIS